METLSLTHSESELVATLEQTQADLSESTPFRILLIGDWSGRANRKTLAPTEELKTYRPLLVDRDNLDELIARLGVRLNLEVASDGGRSLAISFNRLDDFHPDMLVERLDIFDSLRSLRARLKNPKTFVEAAAEVRERLAPARDDSDKVAVPEVQTNAPNNLGDNLLDQILSRSGDPTSAKLSQPTEEISPEISQFAKAAAQPYLSPAIEPDQDQLIAAVDARLSNDLKAILHDSGFQSLESAWRALDFLTRRLQTGNELQLYLLDVSFDEFRSDLTSHDDFRATAIHRIVVEEGVGTVGGSPWGVVAANYTFNFAAGDQPLLEPLSMIATEAGAPFIGGVTSHLLGCESLAATPDPDDWRRVVDNSTEEWWNRVTTLPGAAYIGLSLPRFLLRLPYGKDTEPTEEFDFEEIAANADMAEHHEKYLWANSSFAVVFVLARAFAEEDWEFRSPDQLNIEGLPLHVHKPDGETEIKPCAEVLLTMRGAERIINRGFMPLLSMKDSDVIRLGMLQSISRSPLRGSWLAR